MEWRIESEPTEPARPDLIRLEGEFDLYASPAFAAELSGRIAAGRNRVELDFGGVSYLDSCGVGVIIKLLQQTRAGGGRLCFRGLAGMPRRVLELAHVLHLLEETDRPAIRKAEDAPCR